MYYTSEKEIVLQYFPAIDFCGYVCLWKSSPSTSNIFPIKQLSRCYTDLKSNQELSFSLSRLPDRRKNWDSIGSGRHLEQLNKENLASKTLLSGSKNHKQVFSRKLLLLSLFGVTKQSLWHETNTSRMEHILSVSLNTSSAFVASCHLGFVET